MSWETIPLSEICNIRPSKGEVKLALKPDDEVTFLGMEHLGIKQKFTAPQIIKRLNEVSGSYTYFAENDVLLAKITPCFENGKLGIAKNLINGVGFGSSEFIVFRPKPELSNEWLYYFLLRDDFRIDGARNMSGAVGHKRVNKEFIEKTLIPLPPLPVQQKIVAKLDAIFVEIDRASAAAEANAKNAEALFQSYLTEVFERGGENWADQRLSDVALDIGRGKSKHRPRNDESLYGGIYPFIQTGDVRNAKKFITSYTQTYNEKGLIQSKLWNANTVCITIAANIAEIGILEFDACFPDSIIGIVVDKEKISKDFLYLMLLFAQQLIKSKSKGSAQENINMGTFEEMIFKVPPRNLQDKIVDELNNIQDLTDSILNSQLIKVRQLNILKQSILQQAFNGELVKD